MSTQPLARSEPSDGGLALKILVFLPVAFLVFMSPQLIIMLPFVGIGLLYHPKTKIHGIFLSFSVLYFALAMVLAAYGFQQQKIGFPNMMDTALYVMSYNNVFEHMGPLVYPILIWGTFLLPVAALEVGYWLYRRDWKFMIVLLIGAIVAVNFIIVDFRRESAAHFTAVRAYAGQTVPWDELVAQCGPPAYHRDYLDSHVYTNGDLCAYVTVDDQGIATVFDRIGAFLD